MGIFKGYIKRVMGRRSDALGKDKTVILGPASGYYLSQEILDPNLLRDLEVASRPTISPSPVFVLQLQVPESTPWTPLDLGPWTADPQNPVPGTKGSAASVVLYLSVSGAGGIRIFLRKRGDASDAGTFQHGSKFDFPNSAMMMLGVDDDQFVEYRVEGKGTVDLRFVGYFDRPSIPTPQVP